MVYLLGVTPYSMAGTSIYSEWWEHLPHDKYYNIGHVTNTENIVKSAQPIYYISALKKDNFQTNVNTHTSF